MKFQFLKSLSILGLASLTLASCGSANKSISCDGIKVYDNLEQAQDDGMDRIPLVSFTADQEKFNFNLDDGYSGTTIFAEKSQITVEGSKIIINDDSEYVRKYLGEGPYELSLETCPSNLTPAVQYIINLSF